MNAVPRDAIGLGLRACHADALATRSAAGVDLFEALAENHFGDALLPRLALQRAAALAPVIVHTTGLNLLGSDPFDADHLRRLRALADHLDAPWVTDHLCWTGHRGVRTHELLPFPLTEATLRWAVHRVQHVQDALRRPFGVENLAAMLHTTDDTLAAAEWTADLVHTTGCGVLLDVNNLWIAHHNTGADPMHLLDRLRPTDVFYAHLAGFHTPRRGPIVDTHDAPVSDPVWHVYAAAWRRLGPFPTLLEWDAAIPGYGRCRDEVQLARAHRPEPAPSPPPPRRHVEPVHTAPVELTTWQDALLDVITSPLVWTPPHVHTPTEAYPASTVARVRDEPRYTALDRLRTTHEGVWFRWLEVVRAELSALADVLGDWDLNRVTTAHLTHHLPTSWDVSRIAYGLQLHGTAWDHPAAHDAIALDHARHELRHAPDPIPLRVDGDLAAARLLPSPTVRRVRLGDTTRLLVRMPDHTLHEADLDPALAHLLELLDEHPLATALAHLEQAWPAPDLPNRVKAWLHTGARMGWWKTV